MGPIVITRQGFLQDGLTSYGDLYPTLKLKWNEGVNNYMVYATGDIPSVTTVLPGSPISAHRSRRDRCRWRLYLHEPHDRHRIVGRCRLHLQFKNPDTQYQSGIDSTSTGACRSSCRSRFLLVLSAVPISRSPMTSVSRLSRWLPLARGRYRCADWIHFPDRSQSGVSGPEGIWQVRRRQPAIRLEHLADILDLGGCAGHDIDAGQTSSAEIAARDIAFV